MSQHSIAPFRWSVRGVYSSSPRIFQPNMSRFFLIFSGCKFFKTHYLMKFCGCGQNRRVIVSVACVFFKKKTTKKFTKSSASQSKIKQEAFNLDKGIQWTMNIVASLSRRQDDANPERQTKMEVCLFFFLNKFIMLCYPTKNGWLKTQHGRPYFVKQCFVGCWCDGPPPSNEICL